MQNANWGLRLTVGLALVMTVTAGAAESTVYVDLAEVFKSYHKTVTQEGLLRKREDVYKERATELAAEVEVLKKARDEEHEKSLNIALSDEARAQHREQALATDAQYREKQDEIRTFFGQKQKELRDQYMEIRQGLVKEIVAQLNVLADREGYELVLDVSGMTNNALPVVLRWPKEKEITKQLIGEINAGHEAAQPQDGAAAQDAE